MGLHHGKSVTEGYNVLDGERGVDDGVPRAAEGVTPVDVEEPVMPAPEFPTFTRTAGLPHQSPGNGFESGRDSRAR
ncbi:hypothetical protein Q0Z83_078890 [Actinoplanes sichuanensis]|jgi:hypothetical protein|nr:hypothetical protein Q0Z83_078890 [Actinoplanes sichuanensis]